MQTLSANPNADSTAIPSGFNSLGRRLRLCYVPYYKLILPRRRLRIPAF